MTKVATQGMNKGGNWVRSYSLSYGTDGIHWASYTLMDGHIKVYQQSKSQFECQTRLIYLLHFQTTPKVYKGLSKTLKILYNGKNPSLEVYLLSWKKGQDLGFELKFTDGTDSEQYYIFFTSNLALFTLATVTLLYRQLHCT